MNKKLVKLLAWVLAIMMVVSILPLSVFAAEDDGITVVSEGPVAKVGNTEYATIDEAIANWTNGTTLTLLANVTLSDVIKLSSTEYHILDLSTYTMTAASGKDAIQYVVNGRSSAGYALDIKADATNPGGITAAGKTIVSHIKPSSGAPSKDRPITRFYGGVFNASYVVKQGATNRLGFMTSGYTGASAPYFQFYGGVFNGTIYTNRSQNQFHGGTFNGSMQMSVDSSAYTQIAGGTFKNLSNSMGSTLNNDKFVIGTAKGANNGSVCIDENGYYVITTTTPTNAEASVASNYNSNNYFYYSTVNTNGMYYEDVYDALEANKTGTVTVFTDTLDLEGSSFTGTIVVPEGKTLTITNAPEGLKTEGQVVIAKDVAKIGETGYKTLAEAIAAVQNGETITLLDDCAENVTLTEKVGLYYTIDGNGKTMTGKITVNALSDTNDNRRITIKNINFVNENDTAVDFISSVNTNHYPRLTVEGCTFTGNGKDVDVALRLKGSHSVIIKDCTGTGLHSFLQNTAGWKLSIENVTVTESKGGFALGTVQGVTVKGCEVDVAGYGIRMDAQYNNNAVIESNTVKAFIPVVVRKASVESNITFAGTNEMTATNTDGLWCAIGTSEYEENGSLPSASAGKVTVTINDNGLNNDGVYGNYVEDPTLGKVAQIGDQYFETLQAAIDAATAGQTITFIADITEDVTISKAVTIDGAGKTYTGKMTLKADTTIKNVNFDGKGYNGYAVETRGASYLTIEDCTAKNYGYGFVQTASGTALTTVKNVTVSNMNYGVKVDYSNAVVLENVDITAAVAAVLNSNYGEKTITIKNSKLNILGTWERNDTTKTTYVFEGANTIDKFITEATDSFKLAAGATLTAPDGLTVTTDVAGGNVKYENGKYFVKLGLAGSGTAADPYQIGSAEDLIMFRDSVNAGETKYNAPGVYVALTADIDLAGINWVGIGSATAEHGFMGNFDGNGFKIKNLTITNPAVDADGYAYAGFFSITEGAAGAENVIKNLIIENVTISTTGDIVAAAIAYPYYTTVENITVCGDINITGGNYTAGALAYTRRCVNASNVTVSGNAGSTITGKVTVGGVISDIQMNGGLTANYSNFAVSGVTITGEKSVGGIAGIICKQTLNGATVKNVTLVCDNAAVGTVAGSWGDVSTIKKVTVENVTGATAVIGATYKDGKAVEAKIGDTYYATFEQAVNVAFATAYANNGAKQTVKTAADEAYATLGVWGGIDWTLTADGTLTIAPTKGTPTQIANRPKQFTVGQWPEAVRYNSKGDGVAIEGWPYSRTAVKKLIIEEGVTSIGSFAAQSFTNLTGEVVIPSTVTYIGQEAFQKSTMTKLTFAAGGTEELCIAQGAFKNLIIEEVALPSDRPVHLHAWVFNNCHNLKTAYLPATLVSVHGTNHIDYFKDFNAHSNPTWTQSSEIFAYNENMETITFGSEAVRDMFYAKNNGTSKDYTVANVGLTTYCDLQAAIDAAQDGETVKLIKNVTLTDTLTIPAGKTITLDLNGKTLYGSILAPKAELTIMNGKIVNKDKSVSAIEINAGKLMLKGVDVNSERHAIRIDGEVIATIAGGTYKVTGTNKGTYHALNVSGKAKVTVEDGTFVGPKGTAADSGAAVNVQSGASVVILYGNFSGGKSNTLACAGDLTVKGGIFDQNPSAYVADGCCVASTAEGFKVATHKLVAGEVVAPTVDAQGYTVYACAHCGASENRDYVDALVAVAAVNGTKYTTLAQAIENATAGSTIVFLADVNENVTISKNLTIDGNGKTYTGTMLMNGGKGGVVQNVNFVKGNVYVNNASPSGNYTIKACTFDGGNNAINHAIQCARAASLTVESCSATGYGYSFVYVNLNTATVNVKDVTVEKCGYGVHIAYANNVTVENAKMTNVNRGIYLQNYGAKNVTVKNCTFVNCNYPISSWVRNTNTYDKVTFEGVTDFGKAPAMGDYITVVKGVQVGNKIYGSFADALAAANDGDTIKLFADFTISKTITINKSITIDGNGKTITYTGTDRAFQITGGTVVINDLTVTMTNAPEGSRGINLYNGATNAAIDVTLNNVTVNGGKAYAVNIGGGKDNKLTINGSTLTGYAAINVHTSSVNHTIVVEGSTLNGKNHNNNYHFGAVVVDGTNAHSLTITNSTVTTENLEGVTNKYYQVIVGAKCAYDVCDGIEVAVRNVYNQTNGLYYIGIDAAIEAAKAGDTLYIFAGRYEQNLNIDKAITVIGETAEDGYQLAEIIGNLSITANGATVKGLYVYGEGYINGGDILIEGCELASGGSLFYQSKATGKITFKNSVLAGSDYGINFGSGNGEIVIDGCQIQGWTSFTSTITKVTISNSVFAEANYNLLRFYQNAEVTNTVFPAGMRIDSGSGGIGMEGIKMVFNGCTMADGSDFVNVFPKDVIKKSTVIVDGTTLFLAVVMIGNQGYATLADALAAAQAGQTITFLADITEDVTITKAITIDGAGFTYTGAMTLKADTTIKNVNFDGKGYNGYAITTRGAQYLTIEDCTAKNYGYGFVQLASGTALTTVKNVTVSNMNYGVKVDYSNAVVIEKANINVGVAAVLNSNYGEKTITIKNSKLSILGTWTRNSTIETTYVFEGANTVDKFITDAAIDNFKLAADATLTAPEGITVTTDVADYEVKYENGVYTLVEAGVAKIGDVNYKTLADAFAAAKDGDTIVLVKDIEVSTGITNTKKVTLDLNGKTITGKDNATGSFAIITNKGELTITGDGKITLTATNDRDWNAYSSVISNTVGGKLIVESGTIEHLGGTDMAYGIDNLTNGKGTYAETIINGGTIKSTYRAIRMFLNGIEAQNILTVNGGVIEGANKSIWMQDPSKNANTGKLTVSEGATLNGDVYLTVTEGSTEWPVEVSIAASAVKNEVLTNANVPAGYILEKKSGNWTVNEYFFKVGNKYYTDLQKAVNAASQYQTVVLLQDAEGPGVVINKKISIDFGGFTYSVTEPVGSKGTESNGFQILAGNYTVRLLNGTLKVADEAAGKFYILVQNYADLVVQKMTLDGTNLDKYAFTDGDSYTLSNNSGNVDINMSTIIANNDGDKAFAFDACDKSAWGYELPRVIVYTSSTIEGKIEAVAKVGSSYYATLQQAIDAAAEGKTITLLAPIVVKAGETLNLNKKVTISYTSKVAGEDMITNRGIVIVDGATLVYKNTDTTANNVTVSTISCEPGSVLEVKSGVVKNNSANNGALGIYAYAIDMLTNGSLGDVTVTISGGQVVSTNYMAIRQFNNGIACKNTLNVTGGYIYGAKRAIQIHMDNNAAYLAISGGKVEAGKDGYALCLFPKAATNVAVTGGEFVGTIYSGTNGIISGGTFDAAVYEGYITESYKMVKVNGVYNVIFDETYGSVATIGGTTYKTFAAAWAAAQNGDTIVLQNNIAIDTETFTVADGKKITLDMNGYTITATDNKAANVCYELFYIYGELVVTGKGTIELTSTSNDTAWAKSSSIFHNRGGVLTIENGTFTHLGGTCMAFVVDNSGNYYGDATTVINDGTLTSSYIAIRNRMEQNTHGASGEAILVINGGTIDGTSRAIWAQAASTSTVAPATGSITINGGTIGLIDTARSEGAVSMTTIVGGTVAAFKGESGELTVNGGKITGDITIMFADGEVAEKIVKKSNVYYGAVAKINKTYFATFEDALKANTGAQAVTLIRDLAVPGFTINKKLALDFNGHTLTLTAPVAGTEVGIQIKTTLAVRLINGTLKAADNAGINVLIENNGSALTIQKQTLKATNVEKALVVNSGSASLNYATINAEGKIAFDVKGTAKVTVYASCGKNIAGQMLGKKSGYTYTAKEN